MLSLLNRGGQTLQDFSLIKGPTHPPPIPAHPLSFCMMTSPSWQLLSNSFISADLYRDDVISRAASDVSVGLHAAIQQTAKDTVLVFMLLFSKQQRTQRWSSCCYSANSKGHSVGLHAAIQQTAKDRGTGCSQQWPSAPLVFRVSLKD